MRKNIIITIILQVLCTSINAEGREQETFYQDSNGTWNPVEDADIYGTVKRNMNTVNFKPVTTNAVRIEVKLPSENSSGFYEWETK